MAAKQFFFQRAEDRVKGSKVAEPPAEKAGENDGEYDKSAERV